MTIDARSGMLASIRALMNAHSSSILAFSAAGMVSTAGLLSSSAAASAARATTTPANANAAIAETVNL